MVQFIVLKLVLLITFLLIAQLRLRSILWRVSLVVVAERLVT